MSSPSSGRPGEEHLIGDPPPEAWTDRWTGMTIGRALAHSAEIYGDREAFVFTNARLSFRDLANAADEVARSLLSLGITRGDRVAIWMGGYAEWAYLYFGLAKIGAVVVPLNTRYKPSELQYVLRHSGARVLVFRDQLAGSKDYHEVLIEALPELPAAEPGRLQANGLPELRWVVSIGEHARPGVLSWSAFLQGSAAVAPATLAVSEAVIDGEDIAAILFTSGTTGFPKGAQLFHTAMLRGAYYGAALVRLSTEDRFFSPQPLYHAAGAILVLLSPLVTGCTTVVQAYFEPAEAIRLMDIEGCTATMGHQPHFVEYLNQPIAAWQKLQIRKAFIFANPDVNRIVAEQLRIDGLLSAFGLTETHVAGSGCTLDDAEPLRLATIGRPMPGLEVEVRDPSTGTSTPAGLPGELCVRGWCVMKGYYQDPQRTSEVIDADGWFHTGDLGVLGADGFLRLVGRIKEMIRVGGENVAAAEVEGFLLHHPQVKQAIAVGQPDPRLGEVCAAFVELKPGATATQEELLAYCRQGLASFKAPRQVHFVHDWPMSGTGKIQRFVLVEQARAEAALGVGRAHLS